MILHTTFLIPNLHCPTCVGHITSLMGQLDPTPHIESISIIEHIVTVAHEQTISVSAIVSLLDSSSFEVFDVVLDPASEEQSPVSAPPGASMADATHRWDPRRWQVSDAKKAMHDAHCDMCAAFGNEADEAATLEVVAKPPSHTRDFIVTLSLEGMTCSSCVSNVTRALEGIPSVRRAEVALVSHSANVYLQAAQPDDLAKQLAEAVEDAGYGAEVVEIKAARSNSHEGSDCKKDLWKAVYSIEGMSCNSCVGKVTESVEQLPEVKRVCVNLVANTGTVEFEGEATEPRILSAIEDCGYKADRTEFQRLVTADTFSSRNVSLRITGLHCPECPKRIAMAASKLAVHVQDTTLNNEDFILKVSYTPRAPHFTLRTIIRAIKDVDPSFSVFVHKPQTIEERSRRMLARERKAILLRAALAIITAIPTFIVGIVYMSLVSHTDPGYKYLMYHLHGVSRAEWATFILATPVYLFAADHFHRRMIKEVYTLWRPKSTVPVLKRFYRFGSMNMLISLGTTIAYFSSLAELIAAASKPSTGPMEGSRQSYFDSVVFLTMFLLIGRLAEAHMKAKSGDAVSALGRLRPTEANLITSSEDENDSFLVEKVDVDLIEMGDVVKVLHGSTPPCDGKLLDLTAVMDESSLTGESRTVHKHKDDTVYSGTINSGPPIDISVTGPAGASMLDSIIQVVREGQAKRAPMERVADLLTAYFVPIIVALAIITWVTWLALGLSGALPDDYLDTNIGGWPFWSLQFAIAVFVIACPCGLGLAAPTALFVGSGMAAKRGVLVKGGGEAFQEASNLDAIVFDKTGTLTKGTEPQIIHHHIFPDATIIDEAAVFGILKAVEENSNHPLAKAAVAFAVSKGAASVGIQSVDEVPGKGLKASGVTLRRETSTDFEVLVGNESLMEDYGVRVPSFGVELLEKWKATGCSVILLACRVGPGDRQLTAIFAAADALRPESVDVVRALLARKIDVWMLSGDNPGTAKAVGKGVGIPPENIIAGVLPAEKASKIKALQQGLAVRRRKDLLSRLANKRSRATVAMVGDGINDAPALAAADVGIAVASGSDVAVQSAAFVLVHSDLRAVLHLVTLSRAVFRRVILNFFWAALYNMVALPIAAGVLYPIQTSKGTHIRLDPAWAALAMALSSLSVVGSSLLLRTRLPVVGFREERLVLLGPLRKLYKKFGQHMD